MQIKDMNGMREGGMRIEDFASGQKLMTQASVANGAEEAPVARGGGRAAVFFAGDMRPQAAGANYSRDSLKDESVAQELSRKEGSFSGPETAKWAMSMAVAGFSVEDLSGAREAGYDPEEMESNEIVTVLDKIKMHLAMGGKDISAMGGLSDAAIAEMTGGSIAESNAVSRAVEAAGASQEPGERIAEAFSAADVPFDEKTVADAAGALQMVGEIAEASGSAEPIAQESARDGNATEESEERTGQLTPAAMEFLLKNEQGPTIEHIYQGTFSQGRSGSPYGQAGPSQEELSALMPQIEKLLDRADLPADDVQKDNAGWMLEKGIPITADNLSYLNTLQTATIDFSEEAVLSDMAAAVEEGRQPREAYLVSGFAMEERAEEVMDTVERVSDDQVARVADRGEDITAANLKREMRREERGLTEPVSDITIAEDPAEVGEREAGAADETRGYSPEAVRAQRILMEARLVMTTQANFTLMKQGIALDTEPLENVVSRLRDLEQSFYRSTLAGAEEISEEELTLRIEQFETTNSRLDDLKEMP
ncbi:MAG: hypothetical protein IJV04_02295, partial [Lachnospiraceae bacterium]|nr:hypothetical protein [Lachnospiraceae bacterium]